MVTATGPAPGSEMTAAIGDIEDRSTAGVLHVAAIFASHMVLQRNKPIAVFGALDADCAGLEVSAEIRDFDGSVIVQAHAYASKEIKNSLSPWRVMLPAQPEGGPYTLRVTAGNDFIEYYDVLIGEVWLAGGQSNMELELRNSENAEEALENCADPLLRFYNVPKTGVINRNAEHAASWQESSPENSGVMSAVAYYFARKLRNELDSDLPIGIIDCYIGGTSISCWMSEDALNSSEAGRGYLARYEQAIAGKTQEQFDLEYSEWQLRSDTWNASVAAAREADPDVTWDTLTQQYGECPWPPPMTPTSQWRPTGPFHAMLERIVPYSLAGFLWYQGEEDEQYCGTYRELLGMMIGEWRALWSENLPFLIVQLPQWIDKKVDEGEGDPMLWPVLREAQWDAAQSIDNVFAICTMDCGEYNNIHPVDKRTPGERLGNCALHQVYGMSRIPVYGPTVRGFRCDEGGRVRLFFRYAHGLHFSGTTPDSYGDKFDKSLPSLVRLPECSGFELAGADGVFHPATAAIFVDCDIDDLINAKVNVVDYNATEFGIPINSRSIGTITLATPEVPAPVMMRYAWRSWGPAPLANDNDLPAHPFKLDLTDHTDSDHAE
ncbi:sialate O-acetylesterase [Bifidobacterium sp.]|uniref:sialate O-acetylesterase n=1 Tax=Bifidobacterium sp. TaxID=41200 RepID=UPI00307A01BD